MATEYDNTNKGGLWANKRKEKDTHPDYTGNVNVDGVEFWLSAWKRYSAKTGEAFLSISIQKKDDVRGKPAQTKGVDDFLGAATPIRTPLDSGEDDVPY